MRTLMDICREIIPPGWYHVQTGKTCDNYTSYWRGKNEKRDWLVELLPGRGPYLVDYNVQGKPKPFHPKEGGTLVPGDWLMRQAPFRAQLMICAMKGELNAK